MIKALTVYLVYYELKSVTINDSINQSNIQSWMAWVWDWGWTEHGAQTHTKGYSKYLKFVVWKARLLSENKTDSILFSKLQAKNQDSRTDQTRHSHQNKK